MGKRKRLPAIGAVVRQKAGRSGVPDEGYRAGIFNSYEHAIGGSYPKSISDLTPRKYHLLNLVRRYFPADKSASILEIGCGHGALIHFARELGYSNMVGIDASRGQVDCARTLGISGVNEGDAMKVLKKLGDESVDSVVALDVLEHCTKEEAWILAAEIERVLAKGGKWIIHTVNAESPFGMAVRYGDFSHESAYTSGSINQLCRANGFSKVVCEEDKIAVHGLVSAIRRIGWFTLRLFFRLLTAIENGDSGKSRIFTRNLLAVATK